MANINIMNETASCVSVHPKDPDQPFQTTSTQLFIPSELELIRLNELRQKRRALQEKLKMVSNRINFRKKKEEEQLKKFMRTEEKLRVMSQTQHCKRFVEQFKDEFTQKKMFETCKKAKEVEEFRTTHSRRLQLINQSVKDRKFMQSDRIRQLKRCDQEYLNVLRQNSFIQKKQQHQQIQKMKQRQTVKKKYFWMQKRLTLQQHMAQEAQMYERQVMEYHNKIQTLKQHEIELKKKEKEAEEALKSAEKNYMLLKQV